MTQDMQAMPMGEIVLISCKPHWGFLEGAESIGYAAPVFSGGPVTSLPHA